MSTRVVMLTPYFEPIPGGVTSFVRGLSKSLRECGVSVSVVTRDGMEADGVQALPGSKSSFVRNAAEAVRRLAPDVVHAHGHWYALAAALRARRLASIRRVVFTFHTPWSRRARFCRASILRQADGLTFPSRVLRDITVRSQRLRPAAWVAYPAVDPVLPEASRVLEFAEWWRIPAASRVLAFVGPLQHARKVRGVLDLIRAVSRLRTAGHDVRLFVAGDGRFRRAVESLGRREAPGTVTVMGSLPEPALLMARADLYTHISYLEGMPLAVLEAMSLGCCVVASPTGGIPEIIANGKDGILVRGSPGEIAEVIGRLLDDRSASTRMGAEASAKVRREFTWSHRSKQFLEIYGVS